LADENMSPNPRKSSSGFLSVIFRIVDVSLAICKT